MSNIKTKLLSFILILSLLVFNTAYIAGYKVTFDVYFFKRGLVPVKVYTTTTCDKYELLPAHYRDWQVYFRASGSQYGTIFIKKNDIIDFGKIYPYQLLVRGNGEYYQIKHNDQSGYYLQKNSGSPVYPSLYLIRYFLIFALLIVVPNSICYLILKRIRKIPEDLRQWALTIGSTYSIIIVGYVYFSRWLALLIAWI